MRKVTGNTAAVWKHYILRIERITSTSTRKTKKGKSNKNHKTKLWT